RFHPDEALGPGFTPGLRFLADLHHPRRPGLVDVGQPAGHARCVPQMPTEAVLFDYGLTLVTFEYPTACLLAVLEKALPWLGPTAPSADWLLFHVLHPLEVDLARFGEEDEIDYLPFYRKAWQRAGLDPDPEDLYRILDLEQRCWDKAVQVAPGALQLLDRLRSRGLLT